MRSFLNLTLTREGKAARHSGHILTVWQKNSAGRWVIKRDANFVKPEGQG
jgi:ketosteroid isomerase-like protein